MHGCIRKAMPVVIVLTLLQIAAMIHAAPVKLTFAYRAVPEDRAWVDMVAKGFQKMHPEVSIEAVELPTGVSYVEKMTLLFASGTAPDIFWGNQDKVGFMNNGWTLDLTPYIERDRAELRMDDFFPPAYNAWIRDGKVYGLPLVIDYKGMTYNMDLMEEAGLKPPPVDWNDSSWDWATMREYARKLTKFGSDGNVAQPGVYIEYNLGNSSIDVPWLFGGDWISADSYTTGVVQRSALNQPGTVKAYTELLEMIAERVVISNAAVFKRGTVGMEWRANWKLKTYISGLPFAARLAPYPLAQTRHNTLFIEPLFISSVTRHPDIAWEFIKFATSTENQARLGDLMLTCPARRSATRTYIDVMSKMLKMPQESITIDMTGALANARVNADAVLWYDNIRPTIFNALNPMFKGQVDIRSALEQGDAAVNALLRELKAQ